MSVAHCSLVLISNQKTYMDEVDVAGDAVIALHRALIDLKCAPAVNHEAVLWAVLWALGRGLALLGLS